MKQHRIKTSKDIFEIILRQAVIDSVYREAEQYSAEVAALPDEAKRPLSRRGKQTRRLCFRAARKARFKRKILPWLKRAAWVVCIVYVALVAALMCTVPVREAVIDVVTGWFK